MLDAQLPALSGWENFYVIVGSSGAALIGLQFVVIALIKDTRTRTSTGTLSAFGTPTVVHLAGALIIACIMSAPWHSVAGPSTAMVVCGMVGIAYALRVVGQARRQSGYTPVFEDWLWHMILPFSAYALITIDGFILRFAAHGAAFVIAAASLGLLLIAIHNAWDTVTYLALNTLEASPGEPIEPPAVGAPES